MEDGYSYNLSFEELHNQGFIVDEDIKNPKTGENLDGCVVVSYNNTTNGYDVSYDSNCTTSGETVKFSVDNSGANTPVLYNNMIPIVYSGSKWIYSDGTQTNWYNYTDKKWANAVVLNSGTTKEIGDEITEDDIALWYVWIPRYKYTIFNGNNGSASEQLINVTFERETFSTGTVKCINNTDGTEICTDTINGSIVNGTSTYTHPAFTFGNTELTGFWVGKFEVGTTDSMCNSGIDDECNKVTTINIKPNVSSWKSANVSNFFTSIQNAKTTYGISNADSHMIKNMEWGGVAYLKQSKYGLGLTDIAINSSDSYYTGGGINNAYKTNVSQSTTGNIYGVYDMSGGSYEYVMANMLNESNEFYVSGSGFSSIPNSKYYDTYKYDTSYATHSRGKLGDATKETLVTFGNEKGGWYSDYSYFLNSNYSWLGRGGSYNKDLNAGVFSFSDYVTGEEYSNFSTRSVLSEQ